LRIKILFVALSLMLAACTTTNTRTAVSATQKPASNAKLVLVNPEVSLGLLNAAGMTEPREDWSKDAVQNLTEQMSAALQAKGHTADSFDPTTDTTKRLDQILKLNYAVGQSIQIYSYGLVTLPSKPTFDWTVGEGVNELRNKTGADYALFVNARGNYASGGRVGTMVVMSIVGVSVPLGSQTVQMSLVDLKTGQIVWYNMALAGPSDDMRNDQGAKALVTTLLKDIPL
jgi:PBP1b-binding outer membrane lipoprotein LpoB